MASQANASPIGGSEALAPNAVNDFIKRATIGPVSCGRKLELNLETIDSECRTDDAVQLPQTSEPGPLSPSRMLTTRWSLWP